MRFDHRADLDRGRRELEHIVFACCRRRAAQGIEVGEEGARRPTADVHGTGSGDIPLPALTRVSICPFCPAQLAGLFF
jgi:hypothetical protein